MHRAKEAELENDGANELGDEHQMADILLKGKEGIFDQINKEDND